MIIDSFINTEKSIVLFIQGIGSRTFLDRVSELLSAIPFLVAVLLIILFLVYFYDNKKWKTVFFAAAVALLLHLCITEGVFKVAIPNIFDIRERPYIAYPNEIMPVGEKYSDSSFPSGHVSAVFAVGSVIVYFYRKNKLIVYGSLIFGFLIALSRIYNGMHYLSDVLAGVLLGIIYGCVGVYLSKKIKG